MHRKAWEKTDNQPLTEKEQIFVEKYLIYWSAGRAAKEAGYSVDSTKGNERMAGYEIIRKPYIRAAIDERITSICMDANETLGRLAAIARADITEYMTLDESSDEWYVDIQKLRDAGMGFLVKSVRPNRFGHAEVELYSAMDALDRIAKHLNLLKQPDTEVNVSLSAWSVFVQNARASHEAIGMNDTMLTKTTAVDERSRRVIDAAFAEASGHQARVSTDQQVKDSPTPTGEQPTAPTGQSDEQSR